jgi:putative tryptophan/tyrosine transport system substrate-binding protein
MRRREFITLLGGAAAAWPLAARAQQSGNRASIGLLWPAAAPPASPRMESFRLGLRDSGFVEGQNVAIATRHPQSGPQELPDLAAELVRMKVDVILSNGDFAPRVAQQAALWDPTAVASQLLMTENAARSLGINLHVSELRSPDDVADAVRAARDHRLRD